MKTLITVILTIFSIFAFSQIEYPRIEIDSLGNQVVVITIEQAQEIDNNLEILNLLEKAGSQYDSLNVAYLKVIDNLNNQIILMEFEISELKKQISDKDQQIVNLQTQLDNYEQLNDLCEEQKTNYEEEVKLLKKEVRKQKTQKVVGFIIGTIGITGGIIINLIN